MVTVVNLRGVSVPQGSFYEQLIFLILNHVHFAGLGVTPKFG